MSEQQKVKDMISFIEKLEREIKASKLGTANKEKKKAVSDIIKQLERETKNENK